MKRITSKSREHIKLGEYAFSRHGYLFGHKESRADTFSEFQILLDLSVGSERESKAECQFDFALRLMKARLNKIAFEVFGSIFMLL